VIGIAHGPILNDRRLRFTRTARTFIIGTRQWGVRAVDGLDGRVALITGGASGIGAATARLCRQRGAQVVIADLQEDRGHALAADIGARFVRVDVTVEADVSAAVAVAVEQHGALDIMFNNAGFGGALGPIDETTEEDYDITFDVLLKGVFFGIKHAAAVMKEQRRGSIVNTGSVAGLSAGYSPHLYAAAKAAVIHLTRTTAIELAEWNVRVNCVCPGFIATPLAAGLGADEAAMAQFRDRNRDAQPLHRVGEPDDIAEAVAWLASDRAAFVTGHAQVVDGGAMLGRPWRRQAGWVTKHRPITVYRPPNR
jgi:NAD(P)-dependent dehydrogenase (short-subunit alcohol dehydrogenase family)